MFAEFARTASPRAPLYQTLAAGIATDPELAGLLLHAPPQQRQPVLLFACIHDLLLRVQPEAPSLLARLPQGLSVLLFVAGFLALMLPAALGCVRRGWLDLIVWVPLMPLYFCCVSLAAWLAVFELVRAPNRWNKTEHGLARTSRSGLLHPGRRAPG